MIAPLKRNALIVDDEPPVQKLLTLMMAMMDWDCVVVSCQQEARTHLQKAHFDVLITDYHMPQGNGFHFVCGLRRDGITVPAIVMSGDAKALGFTPKDLLNIPAVLLKPFTAAELKAALKRAVLA